MLISALCAQFSYAFRIVFDGDHPHVALEQLMEGLFCAGAVMISYGAVRARWMSPGNPLVTRCAAGSGPALCCEQCSESNSPDHQGSFFAALKRTECTRESNKTEYYMYSL